MSDHLVLQGMQTFVDFCHKSLTPNLSLSLPTPLTFHYLHSRHVVGIAIGYSKAIVVDMGMCLQGNDESELPEVLFGCCTCLRLDTTTAKPL